MQKTEGALAHRILKVKVGAFREFNFFSFLCDCVSEVERWYIQGQQVLVTSVLWQTSRWSSIDNI